MSVSLSILLMAFCAQGLVKFAVGFLVPYPMRIRRIASYYTRGGRIISIYDTATLAIILAIITLLFVIGADELSFIAGLVVGMLLIQIFFHRFSEPLAGDLAPAPGSPPREIMSYAIQAHPGLAWREVIIMTALFGWALFELISILIK